MMDTISVQKWCYMQYLYVHLSPSSREDVSFTVALNRQIECSE
jgi:hypothetical protein